MAGQRKDKMELRTLILLKEKGLSNRKVADMMGINRKTVNSYMARFTPLMSGANAISGITIVGAILACNELGYVSVSKWLGMAALVLATINVVGGYAVTDRMLKMFKKK